MSKCYLNDEPHRQCCCNCRSHWEVWTYKAWPKHKQVGYACVVQPGVAVTDWPRHLCGCEMYLPKEEKPCSASLPPVLDACCAGRMMWFDKADPRCLYVDKRRETHERQPTEHHGYEKVVIDPDILADFTSLPFPSDTFAMVVFDPPHFARSGNPGYLAKMYGRLEGDWREMLRKGFAECFRVLRPEGSLIFKWTDTETPVREILALTPEKPLFGHRSGKQARTHWIAFLKPNASDQPQRPGE